MTRRRHAGFTLIELLIVIGIIVVLVSLVVPALATAKASAYRVRCENNVRQILMATQHYVLDDPENHLPYANWLTIDTPSDAGWLYCQPHNGVGSNPDDMKTGTLWKYIQDEDIYHCPLHRPPYIDAIDGPTVNITSYLINGAICRWGTQSPSYKLGAFKNPSDCILYFECATNGDPALAGDTVSSNGAQFFNDGSSYPRETYLSTRHGKGGTVGFFDFHVEFYDLNEYAAQQSRQPGALWCVPNSPNGQ